jgi:hypothetical protein
MYWISSSDNVWLAQSNVGGIYMLILYPKTWLNLFICSEIHFGEFLGFSLHFTCKLTIWFLFRFLLAYMNCITGFHCDISMHAKNELWLNSPSCCVLLFLVVPASYNQFNGLHYSIFIQTYKVLQSCSLSLHSLRLSSPFPLAPSIKQSLCYSHVIFWSVFHISERTLMLPFSDWLISLNTMLSISIQFPAKNP